MDAVIRSLSALRRVCPTPQPADPTQAPEPEAQKAAAPAAAPPLPSVLGGLAQGYKPEPVYSPLPPGTAPAPRKMASPQATTVGRSEADGAVSEEQVPQSEAEPPVETTRATSRSRQASGLRSSDAETEIADDDMPEGSAPLPVAHEPILISTGAVDLGGAPSGPPQDGPSEGSRDDIDADIPSETPDGSPCSSSHGSAQLPPLLVEEERQPAIGLGGLAAIGVGEQRMREQARAK